MTTYVGAAEAARLLGVTRSTLYAYVSRGIIGRRTAPDGRTSLYSLDDVDAHAGRTRRRTPAPRPSVDVQIVSTVTTLDEDGPRYRGHDVDALARSASFEQVSELLWSGVLPADRPSWPVPTPEDRQIADAVRSRSTGDAIADLLILSIELGARHGLDTAVGDAPDVAARRVIGLAPGVLGARIAPGLADGHGDAGVARRLTTCWHPAPVDALVEAVQRALVLLADHELATSTLAVRLAGSVRADPYTATAAGLAVLRAPLHGSAGAAAHRLLEACSADGTARAIREELERGRRLPGFGHRIYRARDPRLDPLLDAVAALPDPDGRMTIVENLLEEAGRVVTVAPNVDLGLAALSFVGGLPPDVPLFAVARVAGWAAHLAEELDERPVRFRGLARAPQNAV